MSEQKKFVKDLNATDVADKTPANLAAEAIKAAKASAATEPLKPDGKPDDPVPTPEPVTTSATADVEPSSPGGGNPPPPEDGSSGGGGNGGGGNNPPPTQPPHSNNGPTWLIWLLLGVGVAAAFVALVFGFMNTWQSFDLANRKAERSEVQAVDVKATKALTDAAIANATIGEVKAGVAEVKKDLAKTTETANKALAKAGEKCSSCAGSGKRAYKKPRKPAAQSTPKVSTAPTVAPVQLPPVGAVTQQPMVPKLDIVKTEPRTDGRCVLVLNDDGHTKYVRLDLDKGSQRLLAFRVPNKSGDIDKTMPITLVGFDEGGSKGTVELTGKPDCLVAVKAFSESKVFKWTAPRLYLGEKCKVIGKV